ncbi:signal transducer and activator of transcription 4 isoform X1 [Neofelis nebulosa]|uniref:signal transducer and activator of transcription 4 isoform X1 n=2 Tax=Neofelis nebulosa TaxID=61452 RepID=UPI00272BCFC0|nr:signal transducer and activator of transcription 4 isoform X1 [Neofelis nebulosa]XP_058566898.1 signal transducer and activator of transcription 4 isoform X1 [Neofelis nebulosa]XP_058566904.1 signal transducer and activator of transcription 4 isoform X1 [Neofelis nebulosa]XP_058566912.1 signal transducer and activator of transcription 4 isoform X1 [Neofelis nebulosa]XP_058566919.1 signal transducer and activator of transcription 4 isoform X1 [Neofelis nebulosa]XP_058566926.1 signal transduc
MSQWNQVQQLEIKFLEQVDQFYDDNFPMEIRHLLAQWIENQDWEVASNNETMATILLQNLLIQLDEQLGRVSKEKNLLLIHNLKRIRKVLQGKFHGNPMHVAVVISNCLREERRILAAANMPVQGPLEKSLQSSSVSERQRNVEHKVTAIKNSVQMTEQDTKYLEDLQDEFDYRYKTIQTMDQGDKNHALMNQEVLTLQEMLNSLDFKRKEALSKMTQIVNETDLLMNSMLMEELQDWKRRQQIACIGGPLHNGLDQLQNCFTLLAESLFQLRRQLEKLEEQSTKMTYEGDPIPMQRAHLLERVTFLIYNLFKNSFVVERQPCMPTHPQRPMVLKTLIQFTVKLRLLIKLPELNYQVKVKASIDKNVSTLSNRRFVLCGTHVKAMSIEESSNGSLSVEFRHLQPKEMKSSAGSKGNEGCHMVTEELHSITFETQICLYGLTIDLETSSLPVVMISNVSQLPNAWASIIWYNVSTNDSQNLVFFNNPPSATLSQLLEVMSWQFSSYVGRGLNSDQLNMLAEKLTVQSSYNDGHLTWAKFCKEHLPGKSFTFWTWLEAILDLIKKHILPLWIDGYVMGFVSKEKERLLLKDKMPGTFLLRFSESHLGGITFTWVDHSENGEVRFHSVEPYNKGRLSALPFADILRDYKVIMAENIPENPLKFLYPDIPKDKAFGKHYSSQPCEVSRPTERGDKGYVPSVFIPISTIRSDSTEPHSPTDLLPMSPSVYAVLRENLSPTTIETAVCSLSFPLLVRGTPNEANVVPVTQKGSSSA